MYMVLRAFTTAFFTINCNKENSYSVVTGSRNEHHWLNQLIDSVLRLVAVVSDKWHSDSLGRNFVNRHCEKRANYNHWINQSLFTYIAPNHKKSQQNLHWTDLSQYVSIVKTWLLIISLKCFCNFVIFNFIKHPVSVLLECSLSCSA